MEMIEHVFSGDMMPIREEQLIRALLDCAGVCYDINFTKDRIVGDPIQVVDGVEYPILQVIGKPKNCTYTEIVDYWANKMPESEREGYLAFSGIERIFARYAAGERVISHTFRTYDVLGNPMLAEQKIRLYEDIENGDLIGLSYVSNGNAREQLKIKEAELAANYALAESRAQFLQKMSENVPGGYHRVSTDDGFKLEFAGDSFVDIVGWTREQIRDELDNRFINIVAPEDRELFMSYEPELASTGRISVAYRICRRDGTRRWVHDSTMHVEIDGQSYYQCILVDITDFVTKQEELVQNNMELLRKKTQLETIEQNMPSGYHRCAALPGCPFIFIGKHFAEIIGFTAEEIARDFDNKYANLVWDEDAHIMSIYDNMLSLRGKGNAYETSVYRVKHKGGGYRWVSDSTMFVDQGDESFFQSTVDDITEYIESLNEAKARAEASNNAKSTFLFNVSHDIRTPMNAIKGFAEMIEKNADDPDKVVEIARKIQQAGVTLMTLMNDVLDLARIERGKEEINAEPVDLHEHGRALYEMFVSDMADAGITFVHEDSLIHADVLCDPLKLTRIGMNMLSNAKKFTPRGGSVTFGIKEISSDGENATYCCYSRDTGIGMSPEFKKRAFDQFERERTSTESGVVGSGLGLAIIKKMVKLMGGEVSIESELGHGTEIRATVVLPLVKERVTGVESSGVSIADMHGKRVLLVEDNDFNREIARFVLEELGFSVDEAENGLVAVDMLLDAPGGYYDIVFMDIQMPIMNGYTATSEIRSMSDKSKASVPIIAMTANAFEEDRERCLAVGMNGHIGKPIESESMIAEIIRVLGTHA